MGAWRGPVTVSYSRIASSAASPLDDPARQLAAEDTLVRALAASDRLERITDASLCHGWAGLLALARAVADDSPDSARFAPLIEDLVKHLAAAPDRLSKPGLMEGRASAHLVLDGANTTGWTRALLIT
ncbi:hypothetical protein [Streptomyces sp. SID3343]|uniref:hypothetical protein n=1 Tax=Streptomyces sp. SID3343 TaxID=2690260 RepID=UPI001369FCC2|nr:hypothetical protein [Streptomyces sp. SID3343]MYV98376.1 hypothetical protein [Streptomyces sp. SID3343]